MKARNIILIICILSTIGMLVWMYEIRETLHPEEHTRPASHSLESPSGKVMDPGSQSSQRTQHEILPNTNKKNQDFFQKASQEWGLFQEGYFSAEERVLKTIIQTSELIQTAEITGNDHKIQGYLFSQQGNLFLFSREENLNIARDPWVQVSSPEKIFVVFDHEKTSQSEILKNAHAHITTPLRVLDNPVTDMVVLEWNPPRELHYLLSSLHHLESVPGVVHAHFEPIVSIY